MRYAHTRKKFIHNALIFILLFHLYTTHIVLNLVFLAHFLIRVLAFELLSRPPVFLRPSGILLTLVFHIASNISLTAVNKFI